MMWAVPKGVPAAGAEGPFAVHGVSWGKIPLLWFFKLWAGRLFADSRAEEQSLRIFKGPLKSWAVFRGRLSTCLLLRKTGCDTWHIFSSARCSCWCSATATKMGRHGQSGKMPVPRAGAIKGVHCLLDSVVSMLEVEQQPSVATTVVELDQNGNQ